MNTRFYFFVILFTLLSLKNAESQVVISPSSPTSIDILQEASLSKPVDSLLTINSIIENPSQLSFKRITEKPNISFTSSHYWLTFDIQNSTTKELTYYLETARPIIDNVDCFIIDEEGNIIEQHSGDNLLFKDRVIQHHKTLFKLQLEKNSSYKIYIHYKSDGEILGLPLVLNSPDKFIEQSHADLLIFGLFYGILLLAAITYLFFYFGMADKSFLYYSIYVIFIGLLQFSLDGLFYQYIMPSSGWLYLRSLILIAILSSYFMSKYVVTYLKIEENYYYLPKIFKILNVALLSLFIAVLVSPTAFKFSYPIANLLGLLVLAFIILSIIRFGMKNNRVDRLFVTGIAFLIIGFTIFILNNMGIMPNSIITKYSTKIGTGLEVIFLSLSMANRIWKLKSEKEKMQGLALQKAEEANELKTNFMSMMSHELRTPLNAIMGIADVMSKEVTDTKVKSNFNLIKYSSVSLLSSVNDILDFSKIQKGELKLDLNEFSPLAVIEQAKANWEVQAQNKGVKFIYSISDDLPDVVKGDDSRLSQILNNLLSNAVKFTSDGEITLAIDLEVFEDNTTKLNIEVTDTGVGIPKEKQSSVFESFIQENIDNKRQYGGFGLGLSIVKSLIDLQKGKITMASTVGEGTAFTVTIPYQIVKATSQKQNSFSKDSFDLSGSKILVVEDNDINQFIMKTILTSWKNTELVIADNGQDALDKMGEESFDIVLMDLQMPIMDGYEATQEIRKGSAGANNDNIPIIAITADAMTESKLRAQNVGMNDYMTKPIDQGVLYEKITQQLSKIA